MVAVGFEHLQYNTAAFRLQGDIDDGGRLEVAVNNVGFVLTRQCVPLRRLICRHAQRVDKVRERAARPIPSTSCKFPTTENRVASLRKFFATFCRTREQRNFFPSI